MAFSQKHLLKRRFEDAEAPTGRLFNTAFETGLDDLREIAHRVLATFVDKPYSISLSLLAVLSWRGTFLMWPGGTSPVTRSRLGGANEYSDPAFLLSPSKTSSAGDK